MSQRRDDFPIAEEQLSHGGETAAFAKPQGRRTRNIYKDYQFTIIESVIYPRESRNACAWLVQEISQKVRPSPALVGVRRVFSSGMYGIVIFSQKIVSWERGCVSTLVLAYMA